MIRKRVFCAGIAAAIAPFVLVYEILTQGIRISRGDFFEALLGVFLLGTSGIIAVGLLLARSAGEEREWQKYAIQFIQITNCIFMFEGILAICLFFATKQFWHEVLSWLFWISVVFYEILVYMEDERIKDGREHSRERR